MSSSENLAGPDWQRDLAAHLGEATSALSKADSALRQAASMASGHSATRSFNQIETIIPGLFLVRDCVSKEFWTWRNRIDSATEQAQQESTC